MIPSDAQMTANGVFELEDGEDQDSSETGRPTLKPGDVVHARRDVVWVTFDNADTLVSISDVLERGKSVVLTADSIAANPRLLADIDSEDGALARGRWPEDAPLWRQPGDEVWLREREQRRQDAMAIRDYDRRTEALLSLSKTMPLPSTSRTLQQIDGGRDSGFDNPIPRPRGDAA